MSPNEWFNCIPGYDYNGLGREYPTSSSYSRNRTHANENEQIIKRRNDHAT